MAPGGGEQQGQGLPRDPEASEPWFQAPPTSRTVCSPTPAPVPLCPLLASCPLRLPAPTRLAQPAVAVCWPQKPQPCPRAHSTLLAVWRSPRHCPPCTSPAPAPGVATPAPGSCPPCTPQHRCHCTQKPPDTNEGPPDSPDTPPISSQHLPVRAVYRALSTSPKCKGGQGAGGRFAGPLPAALAGQTLHCPGKPCP